MVQFIRMVVQEGPQAFLKVNQLDAQRVMSRRCFDMLVTHFVPR